MHSVIDTSDACLSIHTPRVRMPDHFIILILQHYTRRHSVFRYDRSHFSRMDVCRICFIVFVLVQFNFGVANRSGLVHLSVVFLLEQFVIQHSVLLKSLLD